MALEHRLREAIDAFHSRMRHDLDSHVRSLTSDILRVAQENQDEWRQQFERGVIEGRNSAERDFLSRLDQERADAVREAEQRLAVGHGEPSTSLSPAVSSFSSKDLPRDIRIPTLHRILASIRQINDAVTLSGILGALAHGAAAEAPRVAILLVENDMFRVWSHSGFAPAQVPVDTPIAQAGGLAMALTLRQTLFVSTSSSRDPEGPSFMRVPIGHTRVTVPLVVGGDVVAMLYADDVGRREDQEYAPLWTDEVDLLVRHAAMRLENVTKSHAVEVMSK